MVVLAALAAYSSSFSGAFVLDDHLAIIDNPSIRRLGGALSPPADASTFGRPLLNLTFALNYAIGGMNVWGYHVVNLLIHTLAGLVLFGIVRRTLLRPATAPSGFSDCGRGEGTPPTMASATVLACSIAVIWIVHPLQTEAVTYISQRAESLMGLFYLLTLYCFVRGAENQKPDAGSQTPDTSNQKQSNLHLPTSGIWLLASVFFCLLGATAKEIIVTAPVMVLLYDRTFAAGSFREAWRLRWPYYLGLACTWLLLARLMTGPGLQSVGFGHGVSWWSYALTSCRSVVLYLKLAFWPHPLVFDYGPDVIRHATEAVPYALVLVMLLAAAAMAWRYRPVIGFAGAWFFVILAPTSSVVPVALQPIAEHRMYLSLAAVIALGVVGLHRLIGRCSLLVFAAAAVGLGWLTVQRNQDYRSELAIWSDTVAKRPDSARAHNNLGYALAKIPGRLADAIPEYETALQINPDYAAAHINFGNALLRTPEHLPDAVAQFETALRLDPDSVEAHYNFGNALLKVPGRVPDAIAQFEAALRLDPDWVNAHINLGNVLVTVPGRLPDAIAHFQAALRLDPDSADAHFDFGNALLDAPGRLPDAIAQYEEALRLKPDLAPARQILNQLQNPGRLEDNRPTDSSLRQK